MKEKKDVKMKNKAVIGICRPSFSDGHQAMVIDVEDSDARINFLRLEISLEKFAKALTGMAVDCEMTVHGLENVGKKIETDKIEFEMPNSQNAFLLEKEEKEVAREIAKKNTPEGWITDQYFDSKDSFFYRDGKRWARTTIIRWVNKI